MREDIQTALERIRHWVLDDFTFTLALLLLVAIASFALGRWSLVTSSTPQRPELVPTPVATEAAPAAATEARPVPANAALVASVNGTKFHALDCPGATQINQENKLFFQSEQEARAAGYTAAANCSF